MNRTDAATILNIDASASAEEAKRAYQELFTEHQVRLTNAPTPALRSLYQARLLELDEARDAFLATSVSDADSDLPTDQPSIPAYRTSEPAQREPVTRPSFSAEGSAPGAGKNEPVEKPAGGAPTRDKTEAATAPAPGKKSGAVRLVGIGAAAIVVVIAAARLLAARSEEAANANLTEIANTSPAVADSSHVADSLPRIRESITVARVEFGRGDYDAANGALNGADSVYSHLGADATADTATVHLKAQVDSLHAKVSRACEALKKVAARHPGERTCKSL